MRVLIADDDVVLRRLLQHYLERCGHEVVAAQNGAVAWSRFQEEDFPIVITDWMMPEMQGIELLRRIRASGRRAYVYVILLTSRAEREDIIEGMEAGADDFVAKPFDQDELRVRLRAGERIVALARAAVESKHLASLGQLAGGLAAEMSDALDTLADDQGAVQHNAILLLEDYSQGETAAADLADLRSSLSRRLERTREDLDRLRESVRTLRELAQPAGVALQDADLNAALASTAGLFRRTMADKGIQLETDFEALPLIPCRLTEIRQVLLQLLLNAIRACGTGNRVTVRTRAGGEAVLIEVEDTGCGIEPERASQLLEPSSTRPPGEGLGLSVSADIIRDHGGDLEVESRVGQGSTFRIRLPR